MHLNSNDIFSQIGLVVTNQEQSSENLHFYTVYLEIQLSQGNNQLLEIRNYDDPHEIALKFCRKHKLNELAVQIVENKIIEAKNKQERRIRDSLKNRSRDSNSLVKSSFESKYRDSDKFQESLSRNAYISKAGDRDSLSMSFKQRSRSSRNQPNNFKQTSQNMKKQSLNKNKLQQSIISNQIKSKDKNTQKSKKSLFNKNQPAKSPKKKSKSKSKSKSAKKQQSPKKQNCKKKNPDIGNQLYAKAMVRYKMQQNQRQKRKQQLLAQQSKELTFQPKINTVSSKIVQFRKENGEQAQKQKEKQNKKLALNQQKQVSQIDQTKQCTFKPQINRVSELISQNRNAYKDQFDHFTVLYKQAETKKERLNAKIDQDRQKKFQPQINVKRSQSIKQTFQQRLEKSILRKNQIKQGLGDQQCSFKPKVGRPPKTSNKSSKQDNNEWWNQLHAQKLKNSQIPLSIISQSQLTSQIPSINPNSNYYFQNLVEKRTEQVFRILDSDQDGIISPDNIAIQRLSKNELIFLKPLFEEIDQIQAYLDFTQFRKALILLLSESDVHSRGQFLTQKPKKQQKPSFTPQINKKSKQLAMTRIASGIEVFDQLYQKGLKQIQRKQYQNQKLREQQEQLQMQQCSFKPLLNNTSKYYIDKVLGKKVSRFDLIQNNNQN